MIQTNLTQRIRASLSTSTMRAAIGTLTAITLAMAGDRKISLFTAVDVGRVESGSGLSTGSDAKGAFLSRTYVDVGFTDKMDEHNLISIGIGGIFWNAYSPGGGDPSDKIIKFGPGISQALLEWTPIDNLSVTFGYFPYKYNQSAQNLGEYMFRSEAYPTILYTGGWSLMNDVQYHPVGAKLTWKNSSGTLQQDFGLFIEYFNSPIYDITPASITTWKPSEVFTLGGGLALHRFISPTPGTKDKLTEPFEYYKNFYYPATPSESRYQIPLDNYPGTSSYDLAYAAGTNPNVDSLKQAIFASDGPLLTALYGINSAGEIPLTLDTTAGSGKQGKPARYVTKLKKDIETDISNDGTDAFNAPENAGALPQTISYDLAAVYLMAFFNLDFNALLGLDAGDIGQFKLYGEIAQLGLKNYPLFYTQLEQRRPIMVGFSIPTFGLVDELSVETEYLNNPIVESIASTYDKLDLNPDENFRYKTYNQDNLKWSVHASKSVSKFLTLYTQVANDHIRLKNGFAQPTFVPITNSKGDWYWLLRIQWAI